MDQFLIMLVVLLKWLKWDLKSEKELMVLMLLETLLLPSEKGFAIDLQLLFLWSLYGGFLLQRWSEKMKSLTLLVEPEIFAIC